jgi:hypothetical protein
MPIDLKKAELVNQLEAELEEAQLIFDADMEESLAQHELTMRDKRAQVADLRRELGFPVEEAPVRLPNHSVLKAKVLQVFKDNPGEGFTGGGMADRLGMKRSAKLFGAMNWIMNNAMRDGQLVKLDNRQGYMSNTPKAG